MWGHWLRQVGAVVRLELAKHLLGFRALLLYLLALLPVGLCAFIVFITLLFGDGPNELESTNGITEFFSYIYQFNLRFVIYAGCVWIFMHLFRGEVIDRSLHYYFLAPIRREVLVVGKFVAGWIITGLLFSVATVMASAVLYGYHGAGEAIGQTLGSGLWRTLGYVGVTWLACLGYGAIFIAMGLFLRNPIVPALLIWLWEQINPFLPPLLKKFSVIFYMQSLVPVPVSGGPFALIAEPTPAVLAVPGLLIFSAVVMVAAGWRIRGMEIAYGGD